MQEGLPEVDDSQVGVNGGRYIIFFRQNVFSRIFSPLYLVFFPYYCTKKFIKNIYTPYTQLHTYMIISPFEKEL